jgi:hypothetical protein
MQHEGMSQGVLAGGPKHLLDFDATAAALQAAHAVEQFNGKTPDRDKLKAAFWQLVVVTSELATARAVCLGPGARADLELDGLARLDQPRTGAEPS